MDQAEIDRMFERYVAGEHVRAVRGIFNAATGAEIKEGAVGVVENPRFQGTRGLVLVDWGGFAFVTGANNLEPVGREPNHGE